MILTNSAFYYDFEVKSSNNLISFNEGSGELIATMRAGKYTLSNGVIEAARAMNEVGNFTYTASMNRQTRLVTISGSSPFSILTTSSSVTSTAFSLLGFSGADKTGLSSYVGQTSIGKAYYPQFRLQSYVDFEDNQKAVDSTVNVAASGAVELVRFGIVKLMECEIDFITDIDQGGVGYIRSDLSGVLKARTFLEYAVNKGPIEFIGDILTPSTFINCILENTEESKDGVNFKLKEKYASGLVGYYSTGSLTFREI